MSCNSSDHSDSDAESTDLSSRLDPFGRPFERPHFRSFGTSSVLERAKAFIPIFRSATMELIEPHITTSSSENIVIPSSLECKDRSFSGDTESSFGIEIDVGLGVFDVNGSVADADLEQVGIHIVNIGDQDDPISSNTYLIEEVEARNPSSKNIAN